MNLIDELERIRNDMRTCGNAYAREAYILTLVLEKLREAEKVVACQCGPKP